jgi:MEMO1 family protein
MAIRRPAVAGSFYPGNSGQLTKLINGYLAAAQNERHDLTGNLYGIISPHAGYIYSGPVAAYGYSYLKDGMFDGFVIMAPSHRGRFKGASVMPEGSYATPLGEVKIDSNIAKPLLDNEYFGYLKEIDELEHSLEVQIPFLQSVAGDFMIVPVVIGTTDPAVCRRIGETVAEAVAASHRKYCIIISTDLSHYHPYDRACEMDGKFIDAVSSFDEKKICEVLQSGAAEACGEGAVLAGMTACRKLGADHAEILKYLNSGDTAGSKNEVVGYMSALFTGR